LGNLLHEADAESKRGTETFHFSKNPTIEEVLNKIGIVENAIPLIKRCREFLIARYEKFSAEAELRPAFREFDNYFLADVRDFIMEDVNMFFQGRYAIKSPAGTPSGATGVVLFRYGLINYFDLSSIYY